MFGFNHVMAAVIPISASRKWTFANPNEAFGDYIYGRSTMISRLNQNGVGFMQSAQLCTHPSLPPSVLFNDCPVSLHPLAMS